MTYKPPVHGRDHCPRGSDPIPCLPNIVFFRAARYLSSVTVAGASQITVDWDAWENSDASVFTPLDTGLNPADPGEVVRRVELDTAANPGRYSFLFQAHPTSEIGGTVDMAMHDGDVIWGRPDQNYQAGTTGGLTRGFYTFYFSRIYPLFDPISAGPFTPQISFTLAQNGGSSEDFSELLMEIHYEPNVTFVA